MNDKQLFDNISEPFMKALEDTVRQYGELGDEYASTLILALLSLTYSATKKFCGGVYFHQRSLVMNMLDRIHRIDTR